MLQLNYYTSANAINPLFVLLGYREVVRRTDGSLVNSWLEILCDCDADTFEPLVK